MVWLVGNGCHDNIRKLITPSLQIRLPGYSHAFFQRLDDTISNCDVYHYFYKYSNSVFHTARNRVRLPELNVRKCSL